MDNEDLALNYYNISVFLHFVGRQLYNIFVPVILLKNGYSVFLVLLFLLLSSIVSISTSYYFEKILQNKNIIYFNIFAILSEIALLTLFFYNNFSITVFILIILFEGFYYSFYYISHVAILTHYSSREKSSKNVGNMIIASSLATIVGPLIGSVLLENNKAHLLILSLGFLLFSLVPLIRIVNTDVNGMNLQKVKLSSISKDIINFGIGSSFEMVFFVLWGIYIYVSGYSLLLIGLIPAAEATGKIILTYFLKDKLKSLQIRYTVLVVVLLGIVIFSLYRYFLPDHIIVTNFVLAFLFLAYFMSIQTQLIEGYKGFQSYYSSKIQSITTFVSRFATVLITLIIGLKLVILLPILLSFAFFIINFREIKNYFVLKLFDT